MNSYWIEHRIKTVAQLWEPFEYKGFQFTHWEFSPELGPRGDAWVAKRRADANCVTDAINDFRSDLTPIVNRAAFVSHCYMSLEYESFLIVRQGDGGDIFFFKDFREVPPVALQFDKEEIDSFKALESFMEKGDVFRLLREAGNASSFYTRLAMLFAAMEAIAGQKTDGNRIETDKAFIKDRILKDDELYEHLLCYGSGLRNKLLHGEKSVSRRDGIMLVTYTGNWLPSSMKTTGRRSAKGQLIRTATSPVIMNKEISGYASATENRLYNSEHSLILLGLTTEPLNY